MSDYTVTTSGYLHIPLEAREEEVPAQRETFEAQVLVITRPYKRTVHPHTLSLSLPFDQTHRVLSRGKYRLELVQASNVNGKPTVIIYEEEGK